MFSILQMKDIISDETEGSISSFYSSFYSSQLRTDDSSESGKPTEVINCNYFK